MNSPAPLTPYSDADVRRALARMCTPLDSSRLSGVTAESDARCMAILKDYIERTLPQAPPVAMPAIEPDIDGLRI